MLHTHEVTGSSPVVSTKKKPVQKDGFFFLVWYSGNRTRTHLNTARMSAAGKGLTEPNLD